jgi:hypothetical protein
MKGGFQAETAAGAGSKQARAPAPSDQNKQGRLFGVAPFFLRDAGGGEGKLLGQNGGVF